MNDSLERFKNFWARYKPYVLHPDDEKSLNKYQIKNWFEHNTLNELRECYGKDLKNADEQFLEVMEKKHPEIKHWKLAHTNLFAIPFIGDLEHAKIYILYGNPGFDIGAYSDEHENAHHIAELKRNLNFESKTFFYIEDAYKETGGYKYWKNKKRLGTGILDALSESTSFDQDKSFEIICRSVCLIESVAYHSRKTPYVKPEHLESSKQAKQLVHEFLLPKARRDEIFIFVWRQAQFWNLEEEENILIRRGNPVGSTIQKEERKRIVKFLSSEVT